jgi:RNA polymerase sigma factor (sigma-70 family)
MHEADKTLLLFLQSKDETEREGLINELILVYAIPIIRRVLRQRLGFYVSQSGKNTNNPDAEDAYQDVLLKIVQRMRELESQPLLGGIKDFQHYVRRIVTNACYDYLRDKSPVRYHLKDRLRVMLGRHPNFKVWKVGDRILLCGFAAWEYERNIATSSNSIDHIEDRLEHFKETVFRGKNLKTVPLTWVVAEIFKTIGGPVELDDLVEIVAKLLGTQDCPVESLDQSESHLRERLVASGFGEDVRLEGREKLRQLWDGILRLPKLQRNIVCLSFADDGGDDLWTLLLNAEIATAPQLAELMGLPIKELLEIKKQIPMDVASIAEYLCITRHQVSNGKFKAMQQLRKWMINRMDD